MTQKIRKVDLKGKKISLEVNRSGQPTGYQSVVKKNRKETTDQIPHGDLLRALEKMTPHLLLACEFADNKDENGNFLQARILMRSGGVMTIAMMA